MPHQSFARTLASLLVAGVLLGSLPAGAQTDQPAPEPVQARTQEDAPTANQPLAETVETESPPEGALQDAADEAASDAEAQRRFRFVPPEDIDLEMSATRESEAAVKGEINRKIYAKYTPIRVVISNHSGKLLKIPRGSIYFQTGEGEKLPIPSETEIYKNVKRHGVKRAAAWSIPLGVASFGLLLVPAAVLSGAHTKATNDSIETSLDQNIFQGRHLSPEGSMSAFVFLLKSSKATRLVLGRVIDTEDEVETIKVIPIQEGEFK